MPFQLIAKSEPEKSAAIMAGSGERLSYGDLERRSCQLAWLLRERGLRHGDRVAILMENCLDWFVAMWGVRRASLLFVPVNWHLKPAEIRYIVEDSDARAIITTSKLADMAREAVQELDAITVKLATGALAAGFEPFLETLDTYPGIPIPRAIDGGSMFYSSGTSGRPKGIFRPLGDQIFGQVPVAGPYSGLYGFGSQTIYFTPAPQYHAAPVGYAMMIQDVGGTMVVSESFDAEGVLRAIERWRITHAQFVPTHFTRLLALPAEVRSRYDLSSLKVVIHAAAPCPKNVKRAIMDWWGPIIHEFYGGSESFGSTVIGPDEWLERPGSVGLGSAGTVVHVVDPETNEEVPAGTVGLVYLDSMTATSYHKDPGKTQETIHPKGWRTYGDMGWLDEEGYLYLADRRSHMILSGGVNIYPAEVENVLASHPMIEDVAVFGVPNVEFGEEVKAVVVVSPSVAADKALAAELIAHCRNELAHFKCPRSIDFIEALPRYPNGKLHKRELQERYWADADGIKTPRSENENRMQSV